ncbi:hypothetical protein, partial [Dictyobacter arantiisoli]|uniref:hypothetical protein n=1 Tax=Dictyobacter arantiisoli TaxID=2014874 RepID=UPI0011ECDBEE
MIMMNQAVAVGVFYERAAADKALEELRTAGFTDEQVGFVARDHKSTIGDEHGTSDVVPAAAGAVGGGVLGGVLGAVSLLLIPGLGPAIAGGMLAVTLGSVALGAVAGGFAGSLIHMGVSEEDAHYYQSQLDSGRTIVTIKNLSENLQGGNAITLLKANERTSQAQQGLIGTRALLPADQQT